MIDHPGEGVCLKWFSGEGFENILARVNVNLSEDPLAIFQQVDWALKFNGKEELFYSHENSSSIRAQLNLLRKRFPVPENAITTTFVSGSRDESDITQIPNDELLPLDPWKWIAAQIGQIIKFAEKRRLAATTKNIKPSQKSVAKKIPLLKPDKRRELERVDRYFENYERELTERARSRSAVAQNKIKTEERLAAARVEHERRRNDQVQRHEIRVIPHFDALLLLAEPAWATKISIANKGESQTHPARFVPRARQWICPA